MNIHEVFVHVGGESLIYFIRSITKQQLLTILIFKTCGAADVRFAHNSLKPFLWFPLNRALDFIRIC